MPDIIAKNVTEIKGLYQICSESHLLEDSDNGTSTPGRNIAFSALHQHLVQVVASSNQFGPVQCTWQTILGIAYV